MDNKSNLLIFSVLVLASLFARVVDISYFSLQRKVRCFDLVDVSAILKCLVNTPQKQAKRYYSVNNASTDTLDRDFKVSSATVYGNMSSYPRWYTYCIRLFSLLVFILWVAFVRTSRLKFTKLGILWPNYSGVTRTFQVGGLGGPSKN